MRALDEHYKLDQNAIPPVYRLANKASLVSRKSGSKAIDTATRQTLEEVLLDAAYSAHKDGQMNQVSYSMRFHAQTSFDAGAL